MAFDALHLEILLFYFGLCNEIPVSSNVSSHLQGKTEELDKLVAELFPDGLQLDTMLAATVEEQEKRAKDREELRESRRKTGMSEEEIAKVEKEEDDEFEEELKKRSKRNVLLDLEVSVTIEDSYFM